MIFSRKKNVAGSKKKRKEAFVFDEDAGRDAILVALESKIRFDSAAKKHAEIVLKAAKEQGATSQQVEYAIMNCGTYPAEYLLEVSNRWAKIARKDTA